MIRTEIMRVVNPVVVRTRDGRVGTLTARIGLKGCIEFGEHRRVETHSLEYLHYHLTGTKLPSAE